MKQLNIILSVYLASLSAFTVIFDASSISLLDGCCVETSCCASECTDNAQETANMDGMCYPCIICTFLGSGMIIGEDFKLNTYQTGEIELKTTPDILVKGFVGDSFHPPEA